MIFVIVHTCVYLFVQDKKGAFYLNETEMS